MYVRRAEHRDAAGIIRAHVRSIREICRSDYSEEQVQLWSGRDFKESVWHMTIDQELVWVVADGADVYGFGHLSIQDSQVAVLEGLYLAPEATGQGLGAEIVRAMYSELARQSVMLVTLQSTLTAVGFYQRMGFRKVRETKVDLGGLDLPCVDMENRFPC